MIFQPILIVLLSKCTEMHDKTSRDDNQVVGMFCFQYQPTQAVSEVLATPKSLSGFKANIIIAHAA